MILFKFYYKKENELLTLKADGRYVPLGILGGFGWEYESVREDLQSAEECKVGSFEDEDDEKHFYCGVENALDILSSLTTLLIYMKRKF